jgi:DNA gyrase/topoisomerase IV subunit B
MKIDIKKIPVTQESMSNYFSGASVKRRTVFNSTLNYGRIAIMTDADVD